MPIIVQLDIWRFNPSSCCFLPPQPNKTFVFTTNHIQRLIRVILWLRPWDSKKLLKTCTSISWVEHHSSTSSSTMPSCWSRYSTKEWWAKAKSKALRAGPQDKEVTEGWIGRQAEKCQENGGEGTAQREGETYEKEFSTIYTSLFWSIKKPAT